MHKQMTITLDEAVYEGLNRRVGKRRMSQFIEDLLHPHVLDTALDDGDKAMAADTAREAEAQDWCNSDAPSAAAPMSARWPASPSATKPTPCSASSRH